MVRDSRWIRYHQAEDILGCCDSIMHSKSFRQKCGNALISLKNMHKYSSVSKLWMILISIWINSSVSKLRNHFLKFRNQIDSDVMLVSYY